MPKFRFLPDIAIADIAFEAYGKNQAELLTNCALALEEAMVDTKTVEPKVKESLSLKANTLSELLFSLLEELVFLKDVSQLLFCKFNFEVKHQGGTLTLKGGAFGEKIDFKKHKLKVDVKAPTKHMFKVEKTKSGFKAQVILDI